MKGKALTSISLLLTLLLGGCSMRPGSEQEAGEITLVPLKFAQWEHTLAEYRGHIVVVDLWASWCAPCIERFPRMVSLHEKFKSRDVRFVSLNLDDPSDTQAIQRAREFLEQQKASFDNYRMDEIIPDAFEKLNLLGIPAVRIYDRSGSLRHNLTGDDPNDQFTDKDVEEAILGLLK